MILYSIRFWLFLMICVCWCHTTFAIRTVILKEGVEDIYLYKDHLEIAEDTTGLWTIDTILQPGFDRFILNTEDYRYVENHTSSYWIHIRIHNQASASQKWVFEVLSMHTHHLKLYYKGEDGKWRMSVAGEKKPFSEREYKVKNFTFDLPLESGKISDLYVQVNSGNDAGFEYKIRSQEYFTWYTSHEYMYLGVYYGLLAFLILYNLILFATSLDKIYLFYILYLVGCCLVSFSEDGLSYEFLWPNKPWINDLVDQYCEVLFLLFFMMYVSYFISLHKNYPILFKALIVIVGVYIFTQLFLTTFAEIAFFYLYWIPFVMVYLGAIYSYRKGYIAARFLIIGYSLVLISLLMSRMRWYGIIEINIFTVYSFYFAVVFEAFVFTYAIADRFTILKKEKEQTQLNLIDQLEKNKLLQTKVNRELEEKVADRTAELEVEKQKLDAANKELASMAEELNKINSRLDFDNWHLQKNLKEETKSRIIHEKVSYEEYCTIFPNDFSCFKYLEEIKWTGGYSCKKCSNHKYSELSDEHLSRRCTRCGYVESVLNHTIFQSIKFPLTKALYLVYYCSLENEKMTLDELSALLQLRRNTCWSFNKKVKERIENIKKRDKVGSIKNWESLILD
jgi:two-component system, sensor histidine kinase LadS